MMKIRSLTRAAAVIAVLSILAAAFAGPAVAVSASQSDPRAVEIAERTMQAMGGRDAWNNTRYISWKFMGGRLHVWDKWTGDHRIEQETGEGDQVVSLINVNTWNGRIFRNGAEVTDPDELAEWLNRAQGAWINDTYWMFMPYKLLDPGVTLRYAGERAMEDGRNADVLEMTFDEVGRTPQNKYEVFVAKDTGLVEQWTHWTNATDPEPRFTLPWTGWQEFGGIMLATDHGRERDWDIRVHESLPESVFRSPDAIQR